jgi:hypothetical protein
MFSDTRAALRGVGALGATMAALSTFFAWYVAEVILPAGGVTHVIVVPVTLWGFTTLAPILIVAGATLALVCLAFFESRVAGLVELLAGAGITAYAIVRCFDIPDLGIDAVTRAAPGAHAATTLEGGALLALTGGVLTIIGAIGDLMPARTEADADAATDAGAGGSRFRRRAPERTRGVAR